MLTFINFWVLMALCILLFLLGITILFGKAFRKFRKQHPNGYVDLGVCLTSLGAIIAIMALLEKFI